MKLLIFISLIALASCNRTITELDSKIVGGEVITYDKAPYQVALLRDGSQFCGGSAISKLFVLTAAHCTHKSKVKGLTVLLGTDNLGEGGSTVKVKKITNHPQYDPKTTDYDYAILKLAKVKNFPVNVVFVTLISEGQEVEAETDMFVSGWGNTQIDDDDPSLLRGVTVPIVDIEVCKTDYGADRITDRMICAGLAEGGKDSCQGDSGGPLVQADNTVLVGVVSWGDGCALAGKPGVYSKISYPEVRKWIKKITKI